MSIMLLLKIDLTQAQVLAAFVTGIVSMILAIWTFVTGRMNQRQAVQIQKDLEVLKTQLAEKKAEQDARRVYEFEARKRLYYEYEPLLFQLMEASDNALHRIQGLARTAKQGDLGESGWLSRLNYYTRSTMDKLFVPLAIYRIMQRKLTLVDVSVDQSIGLHYKLAKQLYISYTEDFEFARGNPKIFYNPNSVDWEKLKVENPVSYWRQGLPMGLLDEPFSVAKEYFQKKVLTGCLFAPLVVV